MKGQGTGHGKSQHQHVTAWLTRYLSVLLRLGEQSTMWKSMRWHIWRML